MLHPPQHPWRSGAFRACPGAAEGQAPSVTLTGNHISSTQQLRDVQDTPSQLVGQGFLPSPAGYFYNLLFKSPVQALQTFKPSSGTSRREQSRAEKPPPRFVPWLHLLNWPFQKTSLVLPTALTARGKGWEKMGLNTRDEGSTRIQG